MYSVAPNYLIIDSFLEAETIDRLIAYSESMRFYDYSATTPIRGRRTKRLNNHKKFVSSTILKKLRKIQSPLDILSVRRFHFYLHMLCEQHLEEGYNLETDAWHQDLGSTCAGVIYLNKNPEPNTGTLLNIDEEIVTIENKFNRLVLYDASILHRVQNTFSLDKDPRLTLTIFGK